jgi:hypothetical protein
MLCRKDVDARHKAGHDDENIPAMAMLLTLPYPHPALIPPSTV